MLINEKQLHYARVKFPSVSGRPNSFVHIKTKQKLKILENNNTIIYFPVAPTTRSKLFSAKALRLKIRTGYLLKKKSCTQTDTSRVWLRI